MFAFPILLLRIHATSPSIRQKLEDPHFSSLTNRTHTQHSNFTTFSNNFTFLSDFDLKPTYSSSSDILFVFLYLFSSFLSTHNSSFNFWVLLDNLIFCSYKSYETWFCNLLWICRPLLFNIGEPHVCCHVRWSTLLCLLYKYGKNTTRPGGEGSIGFI